MMSHTHLSHMFGPYQTFNIPTRISTQSESVTCHGAVLSLAWLSLLKAICFYSNNYFLHSVKRLLIVMHLCVPVREIAKLKIFANLGIQLRVREDSWILSNVVLMGVTPRSPPWTTFPSSLSAHFPFMKRQSHRKTACHLPCLAAIVLPRVGRKSSSI